MPRAAAAALSTAQPPETPCAWQAGFGNRSNQNAFGCLFNFTKQNLFPVSQQWSYKQCCHFTFLGAWRSWMSPSCSILQHRQLQVKQKICQPWCTTARRNTCFWAPGTDWSLWGYDDSQQHVNNQINTLDVFSWRKAVCLSAGEISGCTGWVAAAASPGWCQRTGVPRPPHPKALLGDQVSWHPPKHALPAHSPSGMVPPVLWSSHEMQKLKWVIHNLRQNWWCLL